MWDDCMCFPELMVKVRRHRQISVEFQDIQGRRHKWTLLTQGHSELLQHEIDHLDGILAVDRGIDHSPISRQRYLDNRSHYDAQVDYVIVPT